MLGLSPTVSIAFSRNSHWIRSYAFSKSTFTTIASFFLVLHFRLRIISWTTTMLSDACLLGMKLAWFFETNLLMRGLILLAIIFVMTFETTLQSAISLNMAISSGFSVFEIQEIKASFIWLSNWVFHKVSISLKKSKGQAIWSWCFQLCHLKMSYLDLCFTNLAIKALNFKGL